MTEHTLTLVLILNLLTIDDLNNVGKNHKYVSVQGIRVVVELAPNAPKSRVVRALEKEAGYGPLHRRPK